MMPIRRSKSTAAKAIELAVVTPKIMTHRMARLAMAGTTPSARDRKEFNLMVSEKQSAFAQAWVAMAWQIVLANQRLGLSVFFSFWRSFLRSGVVSGKSLLPTASQLQGAALGVLGKGLAPVHRTAVANAKRLARTRLR